MNRVGKIVPSNKQILRGISLGCYYGGKISDSTGGHIIADLAGK